MPPAKLTKKRYPVTPPLTTVPRWSSIGLSASLPTRSTTLPLYYVPGRRISLRVLWQGLCHLRRSHVVLWTCRSSRAILLGYGYVYTLIFFLQHVNIISRYEPANLQTTPDFLVAVTDPDARILRAGFTNQPRTAAEFAEYFLQSQKGKANAAEQHGYLDEYIGKSDKKNEHIESACAEFLKHRGEERFVQSFMSISFLDLCEISLVHIFCVFSNRFRLSCAVACKFFSEIYWLPVLIGLNIFWVHERRFAYRILSDSDAFPAPFYSSP